MLQRLSPQDTASASVTSRCVLLDHLSMHIVVPKGDGRHVTLLEHGDAQETAFDPQKRLPIRLLGIATGMHVTGRSTGKLPQTTVGID